MLNVDFVGVAEVSEAARAEARSQGHATFASIDELLAAKVDAAVVCVPTMHHEDVALKLIDAAIPLLIEKPIANSVAAGERVIAAARIAGLPLMIGYVERYNPAVISAKQFIAEGNLGNIISVSAQRVGILPPRIKDANVLVDIGVHDIDAVAFITEEKLELVAAQGGRARLEDRVDYAMLFLSAGQISASILTNWITPVKRRKLAITGLRGHVEIDYMTQEALFAPAHDYLPSMSYEELVSEYTGSEMIPLPVTKAEPLRLELEAFVAGVNGAKLPDPAIALESLRIAEEATARVDALHQELVKV